jgi:hypothetical protein
MAIPETVRSLFLRPSVDMSLKLADLYLQILAIPALSFYLFDSLRACPLAHA